MRQDQLYSAITFPGLTGNMQRCCLPWLGSRELGNTILKNKYIAIKDQDEKKRPHEEICDSLGFPEGYGCLGIERRGLTIFG